MIEEMTPEKAKQAEAGKKVAPAIKALAPRGSEFIYNRLATTFEKFFDGFPYTFEPHETRLMPVDIANFMYRTSVISFEPVTGRETRALVTPEDEFFNVPYDQEIGPELIDRSVNDNYIQRGTDGVPTKAKTVKVPGGGFDGGRKVTTESRLGS